MIRWRWATDRPTTAGREGPSEAPAEDAFAAMPRLQDRVAASVEDQSRKIALVEDPPVPEV